MARSHARSRWRIWADQWAVPLFMLAVLLILTGLGLHLLPPSKPKPPVPFGGYLDEYPVPTLFYSPLGITAGPDGAVWFTGGQSIGRITPTRTITTFPVPRLALPFAGSDPLNITAGPDGALWFTDRAERIGRITPAGVVTEFALDPPYAAFPKVITTGPDGALWFTRSIGNETPLGTGDAIGRITLTGTITQFALPPGADPEGITLGADGALWFTEAGANQIGRITPTGSISTFPLPSRGGPWRITTGPDGALWFTERANRIGRITLSGAIREFRIPYPDSSEPWGIVAGPDQALWFTEKWGPILGRVTVSGDFTDLNVTHSQAGGGEAPLRQSFDPREITVGPDGGLWFSLWFAGNSVNKIAHYLLAPPTPAPAAHAMATMHTATVAR